LYQKTENGKINTTSFISIKKEQIHKPFKMDTQTRAQELNRRLEINLMIYSGIK